MVEPMAVNHVVAGSIPAVPSKAALCMTVTSFGLNCSVMVFIRLQLDRKQHCT